ncbi:hypothetical protein ACFX2A_028131 [Malus domestica]
MCRYQKPIIARHVEGHKLNTFCCTKVFTDFVHQYLAPSASLSNMGSEGSHNTQNDTPFAPSAKQRKKERKRVALQANVDELEAQNNKITMKNEVLQEQYEKLFETLHETMRTQTRELVASVDINHHLGAPQHGGSPSFDMSILDEERANHQNIDQYETSFNPAAST